MTPADAPLRGLYAITPDTEDTEALLRMVTLAVAGGVRLVQYRNKTAGEELRQRQARLLTVTCRYKGARVIVNDDVELARAAGACGVHLGRGDGDVGSARRRLGRDAIIGVSCYADYALARAAQQAGADYVAFGAFYPSPTKPQAVRAQPALIQRTKRDLAIPVAAIGGITAERAPELIRAGADLLAVITDLFEARDIKRRAQQYQNLFDSLPVSPAPSARTP